MGIQTSVVIDGPRDLVFEILTDYGSASKLRTSSHLKAQRVLQRTGNVVLCENEFEANGKLHRQVRRYSLFPPDRIEDEVVETPGPVRVRTTITLEETADGTTLMTHDDEYTLSGIYWLFGWALRGQFRRVAEDALAGMKTRIEAELVDEDE
ncbi:MAG: SRPBCC family protein [Chloroflexi bacterium]|nr:SRPBCC family protein [Chloroflexota bacterium]